uniref:Uncharacterized protein n=1 Tax=Bracon brevicornis TaxID=1563983 RepID=A0A6V7JHW5_9HYME
MQNNKNRIKAVKVKDSGIRRKKRKEEGILQTTSRILRYLGGRSTYAFMHSYFRGLLELYHSDAPARFQAEEEEEEEVFSRYMCARGEDCQRKGNCGEKKAGQEEGEEMGELKEGGCKVAKE